MLHESRQQATQITMKKRLTSHRVFARYCMVIFLFARFPSHFFAWSCVQNTFQKIQSHFLSLQFFLLPCATLQTISEVSTSIQENHSVLCLTERIKSWTRQNKSLASFLDSTHSYCRHPIHVFLKSTHQQLLCIPHQLYIRFVYLILKACLFQYHLSFSPFSLVFLPLHLTSQVCCHQTHVWS